MNSQSFMHQNLHPQRQHPAPAAPQPAGAMEYDDGFGAPPPAMSPPASSMGSDLPYGGASQFGANQPLARPYEFVLPEFDSYNPADILARLKEAWANYESFSAGVADTRYFPFSAIVHLQVKRRLKSDHSKIGVGRGTGFYIGNNLILTVAHNVAENRSFEEAHAMEVFVGLNSQGLPGGKVDPKDALAAFAVAPSDWTIDEHYAWNKPLAVQDAHDLAVIRVNVAPPNGHFFGLDTGKPDTQARIAVCGYAASSRAQEDPDSWQSNLPTAQFDGKQHIDADRVRSFIAGDEAITYNLNTLRGTSGSPVFIQPPMSMMEKDAVEQMRIIAVHRRSRLDSEPKTDFENVGVLLTPRKAQWALAGGQMSIPLELGAQQMGAGPGYAEPMLEPASWVAIGTAAAGIASSAGIAALSSSDGDISWELQKMDGWMKSGEHPTPSVPKDVPPSSIGETTFIAIKSPEYQGTLQGDMYAHFYLRFRWDNSGVGGIVIDKRPFDTKDNLTGGMKISMQIVPLLRTFPSTDDPNHQVACVEVKMQYTYEWTVSNSDHVMVIYRFYGDGTYDSRVVGGQKALDDNSLTWSGYSRT